MYVHIDATYYDAFYVSARSRVSKVFSVGGHIDDFLRLGGPKVKNVIYLKYDEINKRLFRGIHLP